MSKMAECVEYEAWKSRAVCSIPAKILVNVDQSRKIDKIKKKKIRT